MEHIAVRRFVRVITIGAILFGGTALSLTANAAEPGYGYFSFFAEDLGAGACSPGETQFDFETKNLSNETAVVVENITITVNDQATGATVGTVSGNLISRTNTICINVTTQRVSVKVDGPPNYRDFTGAYTVLNNPEAWAGKRIRAHIHLAPLAQGLSIRPVSPTGQWFSAQPTFDAEVLNMTSTHGVTGVHSFKLYAGALSPATVNVSGSPGVGTYTLTFPSQLQEGWQSWGFYAGLNGGAPDPISSWSGLLAFGIDRTLPIVSSVNTPDKFSFKNDETLTITGSAQDTYSGIQWIRISVDGTEVKRCDFAGSGTQGPLIAPDCVTGTLGPYPVSGSSHSYTITARDTAGNEKTLDSIFFITCDKDSWQKGANPGQFKGCFHDYFTAERYGDAPPGAVIANPAPESATAIEHDFGTLSPITGTDSAFTAVWIGTFTFAPGMYEFVTDANQSALVSFLYSDNTVEQKSYGSNVSFAHTFSAESTVTIRVILYKETPGNTNTDINFSWKPSVCDFNAIGTNQMVGCLYKDVGFNTLHGPAAPGPNVTDPAASGAVYETATAINENWGTGTPDPGLAADNFGAVWKGKFTFLPGWYRFTAGNDDGTMITFQSSIPNNLRCSNAVVSTSSPTQVYNNAFMTVGTTEKTFYCEVLARDDITTVLSMWENTGEAKVNFGWEKQPSGVTYCNTTEAGTNQFKGCLYNGNEEFLGIAGSLPSGPVVTDPANSPKVYTKATALAFDWGDGITPGTTGSPDPAFTGLDNWSAVWKGNFTFPPNTYRFTGRGLTELSVYVDGVRKFNNITASSSSELTFSVPTTALIEAVYEARTGSSIVGFEWELLSPSYYIELINPLSDPYNAFPGYGPVGNLNYTWGSSPEEEDFNSYTALFGQTFSEVNFLTIFGKGGPNPQVHSHSGNPITVYIDIYNPTTSTWKQIWSQNIPAGVRYYFNGLQIPFSQQPVGGVRLRGSAATDSGFHVFSRSVFSFSGPGASPGYAFRASSRSGFTDTITIDAVVPSGVTKAGMWPKSCLLPAFGTCDIYGLNVTTATAGDPYKNYSITFNSANSTGFIINRSIPVTLVVWGFEPALVPKTLGVAFGSPAVYDVGVRSVNGWSGSVSLGSSISPGEPTMTSSFSPTTISLPVGASASSSLLITTGLTTPEAWYTIPISLSGQSREGSWLREIIAGLYVSDTPYAEVSPPPTVTVTATATTVSPAETFRITMTSTGATSCTWTRTSTYSGDWTDQPVPAPNLSYDSGVLGPWASGNATWTFTCTNETGQSSSASVTVTVTGSEPAISVAPPQRDFGNVPINTFETHDFIVSNVGEAGSTLIGTVTSSDTTYFQCIAGCNYSIPAGGSHTVTIRFTPGATVGLIEETITFTANTLPASSVVIPDSGTGVLPISGAGLDFGNVIIGRSKDLVLNLTNYGVTDINVTLAMPHPQYSCLTDCTISISANGGTRNVTIRFTPGAVTTYNGTAYFEEYPLPDGPSFPFTGAGIPGTFKFEEW